jgi:addiction module RelE/StbE family toxin
MLLEYSPSAKKDLQRIRGYISANWGENTARHIMQKIKTDIKRLKQYPLSGFELGKIIDMPTDCRCLITEKNYVFYLLESNKIRIIHVLNEQQNYMQQLFGGNSDENE